MNVSIQYEAPQKSHAPTQKNTTRENPSSSAGFEASSSAGGRATNKALQLTHSSSAALTRATNVDDISSAFCERATIN